MKHKPCNADIVSAAEETGGDFGKCTKCGKIIGLLLTTDGKTPFWNPEVISI